MEWELIANSSCTNCVALKTKIRLLHAFITHCYNYLQRFLPENKETTIKVYSLRANPSLQLLIPNLCVNSHAQLIP